MTFPEFWGSPSMSWTPHPTPKCRAMSLITVHHWRWTGEELSWLHQCEFKYTLTKELKKKILNETRNRLHFFQETNPTFNRGCSDRFSINFSSPQIFAHPHPPSTDLGFHPDST
ncbi:hypothetical protein CDAR_301931 [Caerostris darwini]|uniref:Uncharacterized protein n=1 Tax=Caerostris darwini TaxID=1538125 RepID=A0AAV4UGV9_9ARAC|nr:hypothetical protein CDAR_301931 [Caerostris darwini]